MKIEGSSAKTPKYLHRTEDYDAAKRAAFEAERRLRVPDKKDEASISADGRDLSKQRARGNPEVLFWGRKVTNPLRDDHTLNALDRTIGDLGIILTRMKELAKLAEDEDLSDGDRIDLQIEMTKHQTQFAKESHRLGLQRAGLSGGEIEERLQKAGFEQEEQETIALLERLRAGVFSMPDGTASDAAAPVEYPDTVEISDAANLLAKQLEEIAALHTENLTKAEGVLDPELKGLTDAERIARLNISLLDIDSALEATELIEEQLTALGEMRGELAEFIKTDAAKTGDHGAFTEDDLLIRQYKENQEKELIEAQEERARHDPNAADRHKPGGAGGGGETASTTLPVELSGATSEEEAKKLPRNVADERIEAVSNEVDRFFKNIDRRIKDDLYTSVGINAYINLDR